MGIVNCTPDSFFDGGLYVEPQAALEHALRLVDEGARILDIGGESTRPGAAELSVQEECDRVLPVIQALAPLQDSRNFHLSIDTRKAAVARQALTAGARIVNDISALADPAMPETVASFGAAVVLNHMQGTPSTMQQQPSYTDVVEEVQKHLLSRAQLLQGLGVASACICLDPGIGFGKRPQDNLALLRACPRFAELGHPLLYGLSRKSFFGHIPGLENSDRRIPSVVTGLAMLAAGAGFLRVHDVAATREAWLAWEVLER